MTPAEVMYRTTYRKPVTEEAQRAHAMVRETIGEAMVVLSRYVPDGREQAVMVTKLEEAMFWANAGIARGMGNEGER